MKKVFLIFALSSSTLIAAAQCDKGVIYFSGKAEFLDTAGKVERSEEARVVLKVSKTSVILTHNDDEDDTLNGDNTNFTCNWSEPFKKGITTFAAQFADRRGDTKDATVSIKGKDGKTEILINFKEWGKTLRLEANRYEEADR